MGKAELLSLVGADLIGYGSIALLWPKIVLSRVSSWVVAYAETGWFMLK